MFPVVWFAGILASRYLFGRCVLNEISAKLRKIHREGEIESAKYKVAAIDSTSIRRAAQKASGRGQLLKIPDDYEEA